MRPAGAGSEVPNGSVIAGHSPRNQLPTANEITRPDLPPVPKRTSMSPPPATPLGFEPPRPHSSPPAYQPSPQPFVGSYLRSPDPQAVSQLTTTPKVATASRPFSYYILLAVSAARPLRDFNVRHHLGAALDSSGLAWRELVPHDADAPRRENRRAPRQQPSTTAGKPKVRARFPLELQGRKDTARDTNEDA